MIAKVSVCIPTLGRDTLSNCLQSFVEEAYRVRIDNLSHISEINIGYSSDAPVSESVMNIINILKESFRVNIWFMDKEGIGPTRYNMGVLSKEENILMLDDDVIFKGSDISKFISFFLAEKKLNRATWAVPTCILANSNLGDKPVIKKPLTYQEVLSIIGNKDWQLPYFRINNSKKLYLEVAGTQAIIFERGLFLERCKNLLGFRNLPREDTYMTKLMGIGVLDTTVETYHLMGVNQERNWEKPLYEAIHHSIIEKPEAFYETTVLRRETRKDRRKVEDNDNKDYEE